MWMSRQGDRYPGILIAYQVDFSRMYSKIPDFVVEFARIWKAMPKIVFSTTLEKVAWNSRLVRDNAAEEVRRLKAQPGKDLSLGGANLAATFVRLDLIDEYQLFL